MAGSGRAARWWLVLPVVMAELLLVVAVAGGVSAWHDQHTLVSSHSLQVTATVTRTSKSCRNGCVYDSFGDYRVGGASEHDVLLRCCTDRPLAGRVPVRVAPASPRRPVVIGSSHHGAEILGVLAVIVLVVGNAALVTRWRKRRPV